MREIRTPTVILVGGSTTPTLRKAADATAHSVQGATERVIPKQNHSVKPEALHPVLVEILPSATDAERGKSRTPAFRPLSGDAR